MNENGQAVNGGGALASRPAGALAPRKGGGDIRSLLESDQFRLQVAKALPRHLTPDRFIRVACTAIMRTPKLAQCDQASFFNALLTLSQLGIEPDGRRAHLIPFENRKRGVTEVQLIVDYKGLVELAMRSGTVANIHADVVCEQDSFVYDRGELKAHTIDFRRPRGEVYAAYALCRFKDGTEKAEVMTRDEIEAVRGRSRAGQSGPWVTDWSEMAKKTVFRRLSKWLTLSPEYRDALEVDDDRLPVPALEIAAPKPIKRAAAVAPAAEAPVADAPAFDVPVDDPRPTQEEATQEAPAADADACAALRDDLPLDQRAASPHLRVRLAEVSERKAITFRRALKEAGLKEDGWTNASDEALQALAERLGV